jgi:hypothetical protein
MATTADTDATTDLAHKLVAFLETGTVPDGLCSPDVFCDFSLPHWRLQTQGVDAMVALRRHGHSGVSRVTRWRADSTPSGFMFEFEERWDANGVSWYSREMLRAEVRDGAIAELAVYCTGDWDEQVQAMHRRDVHLVRP